MVGTDDPADGPRRHHLAALAYEAEVRGLRCRLMGPGDSLLRVSARQRAEHHRRRHAVLARHLVLPVER